MSKYHSQKITRNGITFDSRKEYHRYCELLVLQKAGAIKDLHTQVKFVLIPAQYQTTGFSPTGKPVQKCLERECAYVADFVYVDDMGVTHVEDTKGMKTKDYIIKRKLMLKVHGIMIEEV